jgi:hypothetical protein
VNPTIDHFSSIGVMRRSSRVTFQLSSFFFRLPGFPVFSRPAKVW